MRSIPRWLVIVLFIALPMLLISGIVFFLLQQKVEKKNVYDNLTAISKLKVDQIVNWRTDFLAHANVLMGSPLFIEETIDMLKNPSKASSGRILARFRSIQENYHYIDTFIVDTSGRPILGLSGRKEQLMPETKNMLASAEKERKSFLTELYTLTNDLICIDAIVPIIDEFGTVAGAVILRDDAGRFLFPLIQSWPLPSDSAETILVRKDGDSVLYMNALRYRQDTALKLKIPLSRKEVPAVMAVLGRTGIVAGRDYRGVSVLSVLDAIPDSSWYIVCKIDQLEALESWHNMALLILLLFAFIVAFTIAMVFLVWQRSDKALYRELFQNEEALRKSEAGHTVTLLSIGDAVITCDTSGNVEFLNPVAEKLTGWKQNEAKGRPMLEVFKIINEETRKLVDDPVTKVLRDGVIIGLANHTVLISRQGIERPIADSGAPIRDRDNRIIGVVLVFRDQTQERAAAKTLQAVMSRQQALLSAIPDIVMEVDAHKIYSWANKPGLDFFGQDCIGREASFYFEGEQRTYDTVQPLFNGSEDVIYLESWQRRMDGQNRLLAWWCRTLKNASGTVTGALSTARDITDLRKLEEQFLQAQKTEAIGRLAGGIAHDFNNILQIILGYTEIAMGDAKDFSAISDSLKEIQKAARKSANLTAQLLAFARKQTVAPRTLDLNDTVSNMLKMLKRLIGEQIDISWVPGADLWLVHIDPAQVDQILTNLMVNARDAVAQVGKVTIETSNVVFDREYLEAHPGLPAGEYVMLAVSDDGQGIAKEHLPHIFEPFYSTKGTGMGTGLGLATVEGIVKQNKGFINVYSEVGHGSTFKIYLSRDISSDVPDLDLEGKGSSNIAGEETILVVEDEPSVLKQVKKMLEKKGYTVLAANSPARALKLAAEYTGEIHLLLTDVVMPGMNGRDLSVKLSSIKRGFLCLFMSGYTANVIANQGILEEGVHFIQKPFQMEELATKIKAILKPD